MTTSHGAAPPTPDRATAPAQPGLFITIEGGDGVGKSTQIALLAEHLRAEGHQVVTTREPGGTELGAQLRRLLLHGEHVAPRAEALLYAADRAHHVETLIRPALAAGSIVVCDRYLDSSVAYQGAARDLGARQVRDLSLWAVGGLLPDLTVLLDADPAVAARRTAARGRADRLEREPDSFRDLLRKQFRGLADDEPGRFAVVDAEADVDDVAADVLRAVRDRLGERLACGVGGRR